MPRRDTKDDRPVNLQLSLSGKAGRNNAMPAIASLAATLLLPNYTSKDISAR